MIMMSNNEILAEHWWNVWRWQPTHTKNKLVSFQHCLLEWVTVFPDGWLFLITRWDRGEIKPMSRTFKVSYIVLRGANTASWMFLFVCSFVFFNLMFVSGQRDENNKITVEKIHSRASFTHKQGIKNVTKGVGMRWIVWDVLCPGMKPVCSSLCIQLQYFLSISHKIICASTSVRPTALLWHTGDGQNNRNSWKRQSSAVNADLMKPKLWLYQLHL